MQEIKSFIMEQSRKEFLKDERRYCKFLGIKPTTAELYQIGYIPDNGLASVLWERGYSQKEFAGLKLDNIQNRFLFPSLSQDGSVNTFYFKRNDYSSQPIWIARNFTENSLYGTDKINTQLNYIMLVEGINDVLACANTHISNVVAYMDVDSLTTKQVDFLKSFENVIIAFDNDESGRKMSAKLKGSILNDYIYDLKFEGADISAALKDLTQRRLIINQIKTVMSKE